MGLPGKAPACGLDRRRHPGSHPGADNAAEVEQLGAMVIGLDTILR